MNSISVSGKNWVLKECDNQKILFLKENFLLDEVTSKLLSIRGIKKEEEMQGKSPKMQSYLGERKTKEEKKARRG